MVNAFATAPAYAEFMNSISADGPLNIAAHSLGNMVVGAAIEDYGLVNFNKYFAVDAAVALEAYGDITLPESLAVNGVFNENERDSGMFMVADWPDYIANGESRLLASEWYRLFGNANPPDNRKGLTWRNKRYQRCRS